MAVCTRTTPGPVARTSAATPLRRYTSATLAATCQQRLDSAGVKFVEVQEIVALDMLYAGQTHTLPVLLPEGSGATLTRDSVRAAFEAALRQPAVVTALEEQGGMVHLQDSETFTRAFGKEIGFTEAMMKRIKLEPM